MLPGKRRYDPINPPRWCVWRWRPINGDYRTPGNIETKHYLLRLYVCMTQLFSVCIHWVKFADPDPDPHSHQRSFFSIVLRGGYVEEVYAPAIYASSGLFEPNPTHRRVRWVNWKPFGSVHRVVAVEPGTVTLVIQGPRRADWLFYPLARHGVWREPMPWLQYTAGSARQS